MHDPEFLGRPEPAITAITLTRDDKFTAFCDTRAFNEGNCNLGMSEYCPHDKIVCCIVCELIGCGCDIICERINPDD